jgi:hypothetical protein
MPAVKEQRQPALSEKQVLKDLMKGLGAPQARWLVDFYYTVQDYRIQATGQIRALEAGADQGVGDALAKASIPGEWARSIIGIGPVLAAGLLAHIDIEKAPTVGHIWSFAGYNPNMVWEKGQKRPFNAKLKVICWRIGDSFVKQSSNPNDIYGKVYRERKELEVTRNEQGLFADQAANALATRNIRDKDLKATYEAGRLPAGRLDLRARRYAVKLFLAHYHHVAYEDHYGTLPPKPYIIEHGGHTHFIAPPNWANGKIVVPEKVEKEDKPKAKAKKK